MRSPQRRDAVDDGHVDVAVERGEDESGVGQDDPRHGAGEAAEAVAVLRVVGGEVEAATDVENVDSAVGEARGEMVVREGQAAAVEAVVVVVVVVRGDEMEGGVAVAARTEIGGGAMAEDVFLPPRFAEDEVWKVPDVSCEVLPQKIGAGYGSPGRAHLYLQFTSKILNLPKLFSIFYFV